MGSQVSIGDFSVMTSLSRKALRHYHDLGLLEPAYIDAHNGYRFYDTTQVDHAQIIRRFRALGMSIPDVKALLSAEDTDVRNDIITAHLRRMEQQLQTTMDTVGALRELLSPVRRSANVELRHEPEITAWTISAVIEHAEIDRWFCAAMRGLTQALSISGTVAQGPPGGLYARELFTDSYGEATLFVPTSHDTSPVPSVSAQLLPATEVAVLTHEGSHEGIDRSYGALGIYVHEHLISDEGPIRERYLGGEGSDFASFTRTDICWPIFSTVC
jgi:DNA-binding transcriptional MerR regulator